MYVGRMRSKSTCDLISPVGSCHDSMHSIYQRSTFDIPHWCLSEGKARDPMIRYICWASSSILPRSPSRFAPRYFLFAPKFYLRNAYVVLYFPDIHTTSESRPYFIPVDGFLLRPFAHTGTLHPQQLRPDDKVTGYYRCLLRNYLGTDRSW